MSRPPTFIAPGSKSQTQRALILAALAPGESRIVHPLDCDDSRHLRNALRQLGLIIDDTPGVWRISGSNLKRPAGALWCGEAGTTLRFLAPLALLIDGPLSLAGSPRLSQRPLSQLLRSLQTLGVTAQTPGPAESLPLDLSRTSAIGDSCAVDGSRSSQFASGLLMVAPRLPRGLCLRLEGIPVSKPYLELTLSMMRASGAQFTQREDEIRVAPSVYHPRDSAIEGDWSGAAFLLAAAKILGCPITIENLKPRSAQGDRGAVALLEELEAPREHRLDLKDCPDLVAPLAAAAAFANHPTELFNLEHARYKESDRLAVLAQGFNQAGVKTQQRRDALIITPGAELRPATLDPANDHRMAMAFGLLALRQPAIQVLNPECVSKSYPSFWDDLRRLAGRP